MQIVATLSANPTKKEKVMYEVVLSHPQAKEPGLNIQRKLRKEMAEARKQRVKVYRTHVPKHEKREYIFVTSSKDLHLSLGALSQEGQLNLALLLHLEFVAGNCNELLCFEDDDRGGGMLVGLTDTTSSGGMTFHISPVR